MNTIEMKYGNMIKKYCQNKLKGTSPKSLQYMQSEKKITESINHFCIWLENNGYKIVQK